MRTLEIPVKIDGSELAQLRAAAAEEGVALSTWVRRRLDLPPVKLGRPANNSSEPEGKWPTRASRASTSSGRR